MTFKVNGLYKFKKDGIKNFVDGSSGLNLKIANDIGDKIFTVVELTGGRVMKIAFTNGQVYKNDTVLFLFNQYDYKHFDEIQPFSHPSFESSDYNFNKDSLLTKKLINFLLKPDLQLTHDQYKDFIELIRESKNVSA